MQSPAELTLLEIPTTDNGMEVLWGDAINNVVHLLSVPVFVCGVSRDTVVSAEPRGERMRFLKILQPSPGATVRCYVPHSSKASELYHQRLFPDMQKLGLHIGPATFFDPEVVALHVATRDELPPVAAYLDDLSERGVLRFWELSDPLIDDVDSEGGESSASTWELVHPMPVDGNPSGYAQMH